MIEVNDLRQESNSARRKPCVNGTRRHHLRCRRHHRPPLPRGQQRLGNHLQQFPHSDTHRPTRPASKMILTTYKIDVHPSWSRANESVRPSRHTHEGCSRPEAVLRAESDDAVSRGKKVTRQTLVGEAGIALIHKRVTEMGFLFHPRRVDHGIDGHIDLVHPGTHEVLNLVLLVQSKASGLPFAYETETSFQYSCE